MTKFVPLPNGSLLDRIKRRSAPRRRTVLKGIAASSAFLHAPYVWGRQRARVIVVGGGFAGASCARALAQWAGDNLTVTLIEPVARFTACPFSNTVVAGLRDLEAQQFGYESLAKEGIEIVQRRVVAVDPLIHHVQLEDGSDLNYQRLVLAPGIDLRFDTIPGYDRAAADLMPHAWKAGEQTLKLRRQLEAMEDGGLVVISAPENPYRCPPGPYERASLIAHFLKTKKPRSKILLLDAKDKFSKQNLFEAAWQELYPGMIEWVALSFGGKVIEVDATSRTLVTDFGRHRADVANVIPPQHVGEIATLAGVADQTGWCSIDPVSFESRLQPDIHVIGDATIAGAMPKSAFAANGQAKVCAGAIARLVQGLPPVPQKLINACYSLVAPDYAISVIGVYHPHDGLLTEVAGAGGVSPLNAPRSVRLAEALYAEAWFRTITGAVFG